MACLALIERELRVALRKQRPQRSRLKVAAVCAGGGLLFLLVGGLFGSRSAGRELHRLLCAAGLYVVLRTPRLIAGTLAEERRNRTLGLLFLSGLSAGEVFASKFLSAVSVACTGLLAMFPVLALPFLIGGVSFDLFLATVCALPNLLLFAVAVSLLASVLTRDDGAAVVLAVGLAIAVCAIPPAIYFAQAQFSPGAKPSLWWLRLSPAYGPRLVWTAFGPGGLAGFWANAAITLAWSGLCLSTAAFALTRLWRERDDEPVKSGWKQRWHTLLHGEQTRQRQLGRLWLDVNPFVWLAGRDGQPAALAWTIVGGLGVVWLLCWAAWPRHWPSVPNFFITATVLNSSMGWLIRYTAAQGLGELRHDGAYEVLLTTPLTPSDIVWGQLEALNWHFRAVMRVVFGVEILLMLAGLGMRSWTRPALVIYFVIWLFLLLWAWDQGRRWPRVLPVMWASLNCGRPAHAVWRSSGFNAWSWVWILFNLRNLSRGFSSLGTFPTGSLPEIILASAAGLICLLLLIFRRGAARDEANRWERRLALEFREIVREPLPDPADPRFKRWDPKDRFPWGWGIAQHQLHERLARR